MMRSRACFFLSTLASVAAALQIWPDHFSRHIWGSSLAVGDWLFIDGGHVYTLSPDETLTSFYLLTSTIAVDLRQSWDNSSIPFVTIDKPREYPFARSQSLWWDRFSNQVYSRAGWRYDFDSCNGTTDGRLCNNGTWNPNGNNFTANFISPPRQDMWQLDLDFLDFAKTNESFANKWSQSPSTGSSTILQPPPDAAVNLVAMLDVGTPDTFYSLGGCQLVNATISESAFPGLVTLDLQTGEWSNKSSTNYGNGGFAAFGAQAYVPSFGAQGILVFLGGFVPSDGQFIWGAGQTGDEQDMSKISVYDIASGQFYQQTAAGDIPGPRFSPCMVGVEDGKGGGVDLFMFGGFGSVQDDEPSRPDLQFVYVLSLPSFTWKMIQESYTAERGYHSCELIGRRQMVVIGGADPMNSFSLPRDPWTNGIGVFDMVKLRWSDSYDANAAPYQRSEFLAKSNKANPYPSKWDTPQLQQIFQPGSSSGSGGSSGTDTAAIAGGVVGGVVGLAICAAAAFLFWRRRQRQRRQDSLATRRLGPLEKDAENELSPSSSLENAHRAEIDATDPPTELPNHVPFSEMGPPHAWEIGTSQHVAPRHELQG